MGKKQKSKAEKAAKLAAAEDRPTILNQTTRVSVQSSHTTDEARQQNNEVFEPEQAQTGEHAAQTQGTPGPVEHREVHEVDSESVKSDAEHLYRRLAGVRNKFVDDPEWSLRKKWLDKKEARSDDELITNLTERLTEDLLVAPSSVTNMIELIMQMFENGGVPVSGPFHENVNRCMELAYNVDLDNCRIHARSLVQMIVARLKVATVRIPQEGRTRVMKRNRTQNPQKSTKLRMTELGWKMDFNKVKDAEWLHVEDSEATTSDAPGPCHHPVPLTNMDEKLSKKLDALWAAGKKLDASEEKLEAIMAVKWPNFKKNVTTPKAPGPYPESETSTNDNASTVQEQDDADLHPESETSTNSVELPFQVQDDTIFRKEFCEKIKAHAISTATWQTKSLEIDPNAVGGEEFSRLTKIAAAKADNVMSISKVIAESRGWMDFVRGIEGSYFGPGS